MQLLDWLELKNQKISEFAADHGRVVSTVWRHAHGKTRPEADEIEFYSEATKGAVTVQDWHELALKRAPPDDSDAATTAAATG